MSRRFDERLVLITGASSGIGKAAVERFVEAGARVVAVARDLDRLRTLADSLGGTNAVIPIEADVTDARAMQSMVRRTIDEAGVPDIVVANAGIGLDALFVETSDESLHQVFDVNVFGLVRSVRPFLPGMLERGSGRILLISSIVGKRGIPHYSAYSASKFALHGMAEALRSELHGSGVTVGLVCPSSTDTEFEQRRLSEGPRQRRVRPRSHSADFVARAILRMAGSRRRELLLAVDAKLLNLANRLVPGLVDGMLSRMLTRKKS